MEKVGKPDQKFITKDAVNSVKKYWSKLFKDEDKIAKRKFAEPTNSLSIAYCKPGQPANLNWVIKNNTDFKWAKEGVYLACKNKAPGALSIKREMFTDRLGRRQTIALFVNVLIPADMQGVSEIKLTFNFEKDTPNEKGKLVPQPFGYELFAIIALNEEGTLGSSASELQAYANEFESSSIERSMSQSS